MLDKKYGKPYIDPMNLKNHIKQHRARLDLTQQDLAERVGVRRQTILAVEKGKYVPSALLAFQIAKFLGMKVDELFELEEEGVAE
jgi:putative transcriptional regulator